MVLLKLHFKQLSEIHYSAVNNLLNTEEELAEQIRNSENTLNCIRLDCFQLSQIPNMDLKMVQNYYDTSELMFTEVYAHNMIRIRKLCS